MTQQWYAVQVQPRKEALACLHLGRQDFAHFAPRIARTRHRAGRVLDVREALFPGYVFVSLDVTRDSWRSVNGTIGVSRLVMFGDTPACLPAGFVEGLATRSDAHGVVDFDAPLAEGDAVRIVGGALDDVTGILLSGDRHARVMVLVDLLSGPRRVQVPRARLIAA
jgi:transcription elongation factor/antiterminator RfaH